jgi:hypothetical protein
MDQMCFECNAEDASLSSEVRTLMLCVGIVVVIAAIFVVHRLYQVHAARGEQRDAGTMHWVKPSFSAGGAAPLPIYGKICISHYQILTQFRKPSQLPVAMLLNTHLKRLLLVSRALRHRLSRHLPELARRAIRALPGPIHVHR